MVIFTCAKRKKSSFKIEESLINVIGLVPVNPTQMFGKFDDKRVGSASYIIITEVKKCLNKAVT